MKKAKGKKGVAMKSRNRKLVGLRRSNPKVFTYALLGKIFGIDKTAEDIFKRDQAKYPPK